MIEDKLLKYKFKEREEIHFRVGIQRGKHLGMERLSEETLWCGKIEWEDILVSGDRERRHFWIEEIEFRERL